MRVYKSVDLDQAKSHLLICGDLTASCANCRSVGLKLDTVKCPECQTDFKYIAFINVKENMPKLLKLNDSRPDLTLIDYEDFKRLTAALKARELLG